MNETTIIDSLTGELVALDTLNLLQPATRCERCAGPTEDDRYGLCNNCWLYSDTEMEDQR